ncbi:MAG: TadE/TadG family type IV pilus assembly protein [Nocardioides sp.]|uniref:TadE/TadG family type IV pilus assembly protein n=1 Tax=Nocardioides sp. TaxID=35761 RepID=UPI0039E6F297
MRAHALRGPDEPHTSAAPPEAGRERGAVIVEFALIFPMLMLLVFGIVDFGWMIDRDNVINNVARDAARTASLDGSYAAIVAVVTDELENVGIDYPGTSVSVTITCTNATGSDCTNATNYDSYAVSGSSVKVSIAYTHHWITPVGAVCGLIGSSSCTGSTILLEGTSEMVRE